jgi:hypothetical protein
MMTNECTSLAGHDFDGHVDAWVQCRTHCPMQPVQGYTGSLSGRDHRATNGSLSPRCPPGPMQQTTMKKYTYFAGHSDGHGAVLVHYCILPNGGGPGLH